MCTYDERDNLRIVTQSVQQRTFLYDGLGRLTSATTPEAGAVNYTYNVYNLVSTRTDARGVVTTYTYDTLNRVKTISYNTSGTTAASTPGDTSLRGAFWQPLSNNIVSQTEGRGEG